MRNCFVPFCDMQCKDMEKRMMFLPPKDEETFAKWKENLPKKRPFKRNDRVCERHFHPEDIVKTWEHVINGQVFHLERGKPRLKQFAVPTLNFPNDDEIRDRKPRKRSSNEGSSGREVKKQRKQVVEILEMSEKDISLIKEEQEAELAAIENSNEEKKKAFECLLEEIHDVILPSMLWGIHRDPNQEYFAFTFFDEGRMATTKIVHVDSNLIMSTHIKGVLVSSDELNCDIVSGNGTEYLSAILAEIDEQVICPGLDESCQIYPETDSTECSQCQKAREA
uniref:Uncharacterized protein n=1 Tax=Phlebotomus papatasi TaxID=29031 RepID=A0A1B0D519_PHLPP